MTWREFKDAIDREVGDNETMFFIDVHMPVDEAALMIERADQGFMITT